MNPTSTPAGRLVSLDALRGFDMCWILGLSAVVTKLLGPGQISTQMEHVDWAGFRFYDLIFPLFLFLSGVSLSIAVPRRLERDVKRAVALHLLKRAAVIFALGVLFSGGLKDGWDNIRWLGVLQRIGIASAAAGLLSLVLGTRGLIGALITILLGYCLLLGLVPVPGSGAGNFAEGQNLANHLDKLWLPGRKYDGDHDPEGLLSTLPAIGTALLGLLAGRWLTGNADAARKTIGLLLGGALLFILGWAWHPFFPVIKKIWSSSFVLVAGGCSAMLLGVFHWIIDMRGWKRWATPFIWVGANPILLYLLAGMGAFRAVAERLVGKPTGDLAVIVPLTAFLLMLALARWLHRKGIFLRA